MPMLRWLPPYSRGWEGMANRASLNPPAFNPTTPSRVGSCQDWLHGARAAKQLIQAPASLLMQGLGKASWMLQG